MSLFSKSTGYRAARLGLITFGLTVIGSSISAQNHNPEFEVTNLSIDGDNNFILIGENDAVAMPSRTRLTLKYRDGTNPPANGTTTLEWTTSGGAEDGAEQVLAFDTSDGMGYFVMGDGSDSERGPWTWSGEIPLAAYEGREIYLQGKADHEDPPGTIETYSGNIVELKASHSNVTDTFSKEFTLLKMDIVADNNRDGVISDADNQEPADYDETAYPGTWGAIYNVNLDRDSDTLPARQSDVGSTDIYFGGDGDQEDYKIEGGNDVNDITPFIIRKMGVPSGVKVWLTADQDDLRRVHIFSEIEAGKVSIVGSATDANQRPELINGVYGVDITDYVDPDSSSFVGVTDLASRTALEAEHNLQVGDCLFGLEGLQFRDSAEGAGSQNFYNGVLTLNLELRRDTSESELIASDSQDMRVAPWLMTSHADTTDVLYTTTTGLDSSDFRAALPNEVTLDSATPFPQDTAQIGYTQRPGGDKLTLALITQPTFSFDLTLKLHDRDNHGSFELKNLILNQPYNQGGNIELVPPQAGHPFGRFLTTNTALDRYLIRFIKSQELQASFVDFGKMLPLEIGDFAVGHIDEVVNFLPAQEQAKAVMPSVSAAFGILDANPQSVLFQADTSVPLFTTVDLSSVDLPSTTQNTRIATAQPLSALSTGQDAPEDSSLWECKYAYVRIYDSSRSENEGVVARIVGVSKTDHTEGGNTYRLLVVTDIWETGSVLVAGSNPQLKVYTEQMNNSSLTSSGVFASGIMPLDGDSIVLCESSLEHRYNKMPAILTAKEISEDTNYRSELLNDSNGVTQEVLEPNKSTLSAEGHTVLELPALFYRNADDEYEALVPNPVNFQYWQDVAYLPKAYGPVGTSGQDLFIAAYETVLNGYTLSYAPTWPIYDNPPQAVEEMNYHASGGEVHCGSLVIRDNGIFQWWENTTGGAEE